MAKQTKSTETKVKPIDGVEIEWSESAKFHTPGSTSIVHKVQAEKLVEKGLAELVKNGKTETKPVGEDGANI